MSRLGYSPGSSGGSFIISLYNPAKYSHFLWMWVFSLQKSPPHSPKNAEVEVVIAVTEIFDSSDRNSAPVRSIIMDGVATNDAAQIKEATQNVALKRRLAFTTLWYPFLSTF